MSTIKFQLMGVTLLLSMWYSREYGSDGLSTFEQVFLLVIRFANIAMFFADWFDEKFTRNKQDG